MCQNCHHLKQVLQEGSSEQHTLPCRCRNGLANFRAVCKVSCTL